MPTVISRPVLRAKLGLLGAAGLVPEGHVGLRGIRRELLIRQFDRDSLVDADRLGLLAEDGAESISVVHQRRFRGEYGS
jgi:hypothetical protein